MLNFGEIRPNLGIWQALLCSRKVQTPLFLPYRHCQCRISSATRLAEELLLSAFFVHRFRPGWRGSCHNSSHLQDLVLVFLPNNLPPRSQIPLHPFFACLGNDRSHIWIRLRDADRHFLSFLVGQAAFHLKLRRNRHQHALLQ